MLKLLLSFCFALLSLSVFAATSPLPPAVDDALKERNGLEKAVVAHISFSSDASGDTVSSGYFVPPGSLIVRSFGVVKATVVSASDNTIALGCESTNDLDAASDWTDIAVGSTNEGTPSGASTASVYVENGCEVKATIGSGTTGVVSGSIVVPIKYLDLN